MKNLKSKLIESVKNNEAIWNSKDVNFRNKDYVASCWNLIARELGISVSEAQNHWKLLREKLVRERKHENQSLSNSNGSPYVSRWHLRSAMDFLVPVIRHRCRVKTVHTKKESICEPTSDPFPSTSKCDVSMMSNLHSSNAAASEESSEEEEEASMVYPLKPFSLSLPSINMKNSHHENSSSSTDCSFSSNNVHHTWDSVHNAKQQQQTESNEENRETVHLINEMFLSTKRNLDLLEYQAHMVREFDESFHFCLSMAHKMRSLNVEKRVLFQKKILEAFCDVFHS